MKAMVKILSYYIPVEKVRHLTIREAESEAIRLAMSASNGKKASSSRKSLHH
jgi:hypothetical protein